MLKIKDHLEKMLKSVGLRDQRESVDTLEQSREEKRLRELINFQNSYMTSDNPAIHNPFYASLTDK